MIERSVLNQLVFDAFTGKISWLHASRLYAVDDFIEAFYQTRANMRRQLDGLTDAQAHFYSETVAVWSLSETITHLIYTQASYYNALLDITVSHRPHIIEAARGFGEGAHQNIPAETLRIQLDQATVLITDAITQTRNTYDPTQIRRSPLFGDVTYVTWILLLLAHEIDHVRQAVAMRRTARAALSDAPTIAAPIALPAAKIVPDPPTEPPSMERNSESKVAPAAKVTADPPTASSSKERDSDSISPATVHLTLDPPNEAPSINRDSA